MHNRIAHGYFSVDLEIVWKTIRNDLPALAVRGCLLLFSPQRYYSVDVSVLS